MGRIMDLFKSKFDREEAPSAAPVRQVVYPVLNARGEAVTETAPAFVRGSSVTVNGERWHYWHNWTEYRVPGLSFCGFYDELLDTPGGVLVSGATGSGKSVVLNGILLSILGQFRPFCKGGKDECEVFLCDPKIVEFRAYRTLPQVKRYAGDYDEIMSVLDSVDHLMMSRYELMAERGLKDWNGHRVFLFIDEIGDLMLTRKKDFLPRLTHLLNLCRAAGITIFLASQSPSRQTIPAVVQLNCTAKICLKCDTAIESRQVVGIPGGEKLPRHGVALVRTPKTGGIVEQAIPNCTDHDIDKVLTAVSRAETVCLRKQKIA